MRIKSFFSESVERAMSMAQSELGPDALLLNSRLAPPEGRHLGKFEVVFGVETGQAASTDTTAGVQNSAKDTNIAKLSKEIADLRKEMQQIRGAHPGEVPAAASQGALPVLLGAGIERSLAEEIESCLPARRPRSPDFAGPRVVSKSLPSAEPEDAYRQLAAELARRFSVDATLAPERAARRIAALVGPPGAGKTTTLIKLAVTYGLAARKPPLLISLDTHRIAAGIELQTYASILGVAHITLESGHALGPALEEHRGKALILIDTPGYAEKDIEEACELARCLSGNSDVNTHLVLPASMKAADLSRVVDRYEIFHPAQLLFTKLDETDTFGSIVCEAVRSGKPISFLAGGQSIPEDLEPATKDRIIELVLREQNLRVRSAA